MESGSDSNKSKTEIEKNRHFQEWIWMEILSRLPYRDVFRSKLISKEFNSLISAPDFANFYISRVSSRPPDLKFAFVSEYLRNDNNARANKFEVLDVRFNREFESRKVYSLAMPGTQTPETRIFDMVNYMIMAVSDDLVLYGFSSYENRPTWYGCNRYFIANPITGRWVDLPSPGRDLGQVSSGFVTRVNGGVLESFKVVRLGCPIGKSDILNFQVLSHDSRDWVDFNVNAAREIEVVIGRVPVTFNGILHWILNKRGGLLAYDAYNHPQQMRLIPLPEDIDRVANFFTLNGCCNVVVLQNGCLMYIEVPSGSWSPEIFPNITVWQLVDYNTGEWCLHHRINRRDISFDPDLAHPRAVLVPMTFDPFDGHVLYLGCSNFIVSYDLETMRLEALGNHVHDGRVSRIVKSTVGGVPCWMRVFLFVQPLWPTSIPCSHRRVHGTMAAKKNNQVPGWLDPPPL